MKSKRQAEIMEIIGKDETLRRIRIGIEKLEAAN